MRMRIWGVGLGVALTSVLGSCSSVPTTTAEVPTSNTASVSLFADVSEINDLEELVASETPVTRVGTRNSGIPLTESGVVGGVSGSYLTTFTLTQDTEVDIQFSGDNGRTSLLSREGGASFWLDGGALRPSVYLNGRQFRTAYAAAAAGLDVTYSSSGPSNIVNIQGTLPAGTYTVSILPLFNNSVAAFDLSMTASGSGSITPFAREVVDITVGEWNFWQQGSAKETDNGYYQRVGEYWQVGTGLNYDGRDTDVPWSAAFTSWVMKTAGAGNEFNYNASHSRYIVPTIENRKSGDLNAGFVGWRLNEYAPTLGDLVCYARQSGVGYDTPAPYQSHCDVVVAVNATNIEVIGGNVSNSVTKKTVPIDFNGYVDDVRDTTYDWFVVIQNNL